MLKKLDSWRRKVLYGYCVMARIYQFIYLLDLNYCVWMFFLLFYFEM